MGAAHVARLLSKNPGARKFCEVTEMAWKNSPIDVPAADVAGSQGPSPDPDAEMSTAEARAARLLRTCAGVLMAQAEQLDLHGSNTRARRVALKRILAGVIADVEAVRLAVRD
jgi:hypothetical protein